MTRGGNSDFKSSAARLTGATSKQENNDEDGNRNADQPKQNERDAAADFRAILEGVFK
jgi:hypothetical protein